MTSNVKKISRTGAAIVQRAFEYIRVKQQGQPLQADDQALGIDMLNDLIKSRQADGLHLWKDVDAAMFLDKGRKQYTLGQAELLQDGTTEYNAVYATSGDWVRTTTTAAQTAGNNTLDITSFTSYYGVTYDTTDTMTLLVENEDGDLDKYAVSSVSTLEITLGSNLTTDVDSGATVYIFRNHDDMSGNTATTRKKPLKIYPDAVRMQQADTYELPITMISSDEYSLLPDKTSQGTPVQIAYTPKVDKTEIFLWPPTDDVENVLLFRCQMPIDIFNATTDEQDFPGEWLRYLAWGLAAELAPVYGLKLDRQMFLEQKAARLLMDALEWDQDNSSYFVQPNTGW